MATDSGVLRFLAYARGDRPRTADWRTMQQAFIREEITLDCLHHLTAEDLDDLVPLSCRAAYDAAYHQWIGADPDLMASLPVGADQIWASCRFDASAPAPAPAPESEPEPEPSTFARDFLARKAQEWDASGGRRRPDDLDDQSVASAAAASVASAATSAAATVATRIDADAADASRAPAVADPRDVRDAVLHGEKAPQEDGRWLYTHRGQCYLTDALSQRCLATWEASPAPPAELPPPDDDAPEEPRGPSALLRQTTRPVAPASRAPSAREARKESQRAKKEARLREKEAAELAEAAAAESARLEKEARRRDKERLRREAEQTRRNDERLAKEAARDEKAARTVAVEVSERQAREARAAKEAEKQRRAAASAVAAEEEAARAAAVARSQREAREARAAREAERARAATAARREAEKARREAFAQQTVVEEDEEEDEDAAARREAVERSRREAAEERERRAAVERSRREAAEERERQRRVEAAAAQRQAALLSRDRDGMAREDAASLEREIAMDCARETGLAKAMMARAAERDRRKHVAAAGARVLGTPWFAWLWWLACLWIATPLALVVVVVWLWPVFSLWLGTVNDGLFHVFHDAVKEARRAAVEGCVRPEDRLPPATSDRRRSEVARILARDGAYAAKEKKAAPRNARVVAEAALDRAIAACRWDTWVEKGLMVSRRKGRRVEVDFIDDPDRLRALLVEAVSTIESTKGELASAVTACKRAMASSSTFEPFARDVLGVAAGADAAAVRRAARKLALLTHPDKLRSESRGVRHRAATAFQLLTLCRDALAEDSCRSCRESNLAAAHKQWARSHDFDDGGLGADDLAQVSASLEGLRAEIDDTAVASTLRARLREFSHMPCRGCGGEHPKKRVDLAAYGLYRVDNHRDVMRDGTRDTPCSRFKPGQGFAAAVLPGQGWPGVAILLIDPTDEFVYDVTKWAYCRFKLHHEREIDLLSHFSFSYGEPVKMSVSNELWRRRRRDMPDDLQVRWQRPAPTRAGLGAAILRGDFAGDWAVPTEPPRRQGPMFPKQHKKKNLKRKNKKRSGRL